MYKYPLQTDNFNFLDRLKVCSFILNKNNRLTCGPKVKEFEEKWEKIADFSGKTSCVATSSGSTANHLLFETFIQTNKFLPQNITVFCPSTTWASSVTPLIMRGFEVVFVDINLEDFSFDYRKLEEELIKRENDKKIKVIWPTALIGFIPNYNILNNLKRQYNTFLFADLCECTIGYYNGGYKSILSCFDMATTSFFWAHEICAIEMGALFINKKQRNGEVLIRNSKMIRSHGLTRVLPKNDTWRSTVEEKNKNIDSEFLFDKVGTNYRPTDLNAYFGLLDTKRYDKYLKFRTRIWKYFRENINDHYFNFKKDNHVIPFCLPFVSKNKQNINQIKVRLNNEGWETRPIISFLPINPAFKYLSEGEDKYPNSKYLHENGFYVGLNKDLTEKDIDKLISLI